MRTLQCSSYVPVPLERLEVIYYVQAFSSLYTRLSADLLLMSLEDNVFVLVFFVTHMATEYFAEQSRLYHAPKRRLPLHT